jgi:hypothetical protein
VVLVGDAFPEFDTFHNPIKYADYLAMVCGDKAQEAENCICFDCVGFLSGG